MYLLHLSNITTHQLLLKHKPAFTYELTMGSFLYLEGAGLLPYFLLYVRSIEHPIHLAVVQFHPD
jgi:hypothetical protein